MIIMEKKVQRQVYSAFANKAIGTISAPGSYEEEMRKNFPGIFSELADM